MSGRRVGVVLFNLGGPEAPAAVQPFLFNLFNDKAIIGAPQPVRWMLATMISHRRAKVAQAIYARLGGGSPLLANTEAQAAALAARLADVGTVKVVIAMRYWHPMSDEAASELKAFAPDEIVLLPLYPQFSTTTTASSLAAWEASARAAGLAEVPAHAVCCYPEAPGFIAAYAEGVGEALARVGGEARVLFSAHGLPKRVVERGDPYVWQVERSAAAVAAAVCEHVGSLDWRVCYQSRVGPLEWVGPSIADELKRAGEEGRAVVVVPIAFVSEHSETLVELDVEYRNLAREVGVERYERVPTPGTAPAFVDALATLVRAALSRRPGVAAAAGSRLCPREFGQCPMAEER